MSLKDKDEIGKILCIYNNEKDLKRCCDNRKILLVLTLGLYGIINGEIHRLFMTLSEIQRILYLNDEYRTPCEVLRLYNSSFEHFILLKKIFPDSLEKLTCEKLFGKYMHNLLVHAPLQLRE